MLDPECRLTIWKYKNIGLPVELRMSSLQTHGSIESRVFYFLSYPLHVLKTNQNRVRNGTLQSRSPRQACAKRNEDSRYDISVAKHW